jgi:hypothetical protein
VTPDRKPKFRQPAMINPLVRHAVTTTDVDWIFVIDADQIIAARSRGPLNDAARTPRGSHSILARPTSTSANVRRAGCRSSRRSAGAPTIASSGATRSTPTSPANPSTTPPSRLPPSTTASRANPGAPRSGTSRTRPRSCWRTRSATGGWRARTGSRRC